MRAELLVDSNELQARLEEDLGRARTKAWIQTFSFEGDRTGSLLARRLKASPAADRRLLIDSFSRLWHSCRLIPGPAWADPSLRREVGRTRGWTRRLREHGVGVRFSNPLGPWPTRLFRRNHKKLALFDDRVAYLGGINFCDHNYAWHDMMIRVEDPALGRLLSGDFESTWEGRPRSFDEEVGGIRVISLNGRGNPKRLRPVLDAIDGARREIAVVSAYLSPPFSDRLAAASRRGVRVQVLTPARNTNPNLARFILEAARRHRFEIARYPGRMNHLKAMLVDGDLLIAGSCNFDFLSYHILEEVVVLTRDPGLVDAFQRRVWIPDLAAATPREPRTSLRTRLGHASVRIGAALASAVALP